MLASSGGVVHAGCGELMAMGVHVNSSTVNSQRQAENKRQRRQAHLQAHGR